MNQEIIASLSPVIDFNLREKKRGEPYLRLQLEGEIEVVLPMKQTQEAVIVAAQRITPIPNLPECVLGLLNQRSRVFWVVDLAQLLELPPLEPDTQEYHIAIIRGDNVPMGLAIAKIQGVIRLHEEAITLPKERVMSGIVPYLRGCVLLSPAEKLWVLEPQAILKDPLFNSEF